MAEDTEEIKKEEVAEETQPVVEEVSAKEEVCEACKGTGKDGGYSKEDKCSVCGGTGKVK